MIAAVRSPFDEDANPLRLGELRVIRHSYFNKSPFSLIVRHSYINRSLRNSPFAFQLFSYCRSDWAVEMPEIAACINERASDKNTRRKEERKKARRQRLRSVWQEKARAADSPGRHGLKPQRGCIGVDLMAQSCCWGGKRCPKHRPAQNTDHMRASQR